MNILTAIVVCLHLYVKGRCTRFQQRALFTVLYSRFKHCAKDVSKVTAQPTILELTIVNQHNHKMKQTNNYVIITDQNGGGLIDARGIQHLLKIFYC